MTSTSDEKRLSDPTTHKSKSSRVLRKASQYQSQWKPKLETLASSRDKTTPDNPNATYVPASVSVNRDYKKEITSEFFHDMLLNIIDHHELMKPSNVTLYSEQVVTQKSFEDAQDSLHQSCLIPSIDFVASLKSGSRFTVDSMPTVDKDMLLQDSTYTLSPPKEIIQFKSGNVYEGDMKENIMHGIGVYTWVDGTVYMGEFEDGYPTGKGIMTLPDMSVYDGEFRKGYFHKKGFYNIVGSPMFYKGEWKSGKMHGDGWLQYAEGNSYEGRWFNGLRHGKGIRKYGNGARYKGEWYQNKKCGHGSMVYGNNDYYNGSWLNDLPHGYGEYFWDIHFNETFTFPIYNWYKGSWVEGLRNGAGIIHFGLKSGAKLAGIWKNNMKHGPGLIMCGNGVIIEKNPLFKQNKVAHKSSIMKKTLPNEAKEIINSTKIHTFYDILKLINSKEPIKEFGKEILESMNRHTPLKKVCKYIQFADSIQQDTKKMTPLKIPMGPPMDVDLNYFLDTIFQFRRTATDYWLDIAEMNVSREQCKTPEDSIDCSTDNLLSTDWNNIRQREEMLLRNAITISLPKLERLYDIYATISCNGPINFKPAMIRLFLWQLYRDAHVMNFTSLIELDHYLWKNPYSCYETEHNPFEPVYFWQFIQAFIGCSWVNFVTNEERPNDYSKGWIARMFTNYLENVLVLIATPTGQALTTHKNIAPIESMYELYLKIGEPHSVRQFLQSSCRKQGQEPPCYVTIFRNKNSEKLRCGRNAVTVGYRLAYINAAEMDTTLSTFPSLPDIANNNQFAHTLFTFQTLGKRKIINCFMKICPKIGLSPSNADLSYKITFLEFLEVVLLCAFEKTDVAKLKSENELRKIALEKMSQTTGEKQSLFSGNTTPRISKVYKKKKKKPA